MGPGREKGPIYGSQPWVLRERKGLVMGSNHGSWEGERTSLWLRNREKGGRKGLVMPPKQGERREKGLVVPLKP